MSLRSKIFVLLFAVFGLFALVNSRVQRSLVLPEFKTLENDQAQSDIQRCVEAVHREEQALADSQRVWSQAPEAHNLLSQRDPKVLAGNLSLAQFQQNNVNLIVLADSNRQIFWSQGYRVDKSDARRAFDIDEFAPGKVLDLAPLLTQPAVSGMLNTSAGPMLVAARRVGNLGTVVMGRLLDANSPLKANLQRQAGVAFNVLSLDTALAGEDKAAAARVQGQAAWEPYVATPTSTSVLAYHAVEGLDGRPALLLKAQLPRTISQRGLAAIQYTEASLIFLAAFVLLVMGLLLEKLVLSRLAMLSRFCHSVIKVTNPGSRIKVEGNDELAKLADDLNQMLAELEASRAQLDDALLETRTAAQAKSDFLAVMSHEIRTPMNGVLGMLGVLANTQLSAEQYEHLSIAQESAENLLRLLNDILDFSKIEAGKLEIEEIDFNLPMLIEDNLRVCSLKAREKGLELITDVSPDIPETLVGDPGRIRQILSNLINNAIKFTHEGYVAVVATLETEDDETVTVRVNIHDSGIGIPEDRVERLFKSFSQVDASTTRKYGGSGLGLAICSTLAEMMGGQCGVESEMGRGSTFWFTLRLSRGEAVRKPRPLPLSELKGHSVLIVDDSMINRRVMNLQLAKWGVLVAEADSGRQALEMLRVAANAGQPYEVCILDYIMPGLNGQELGQAILSDELIAGTRLILVTSAGQRGDANKFHAMGYSAYLSKPISQNQLVECVASVLGMETTPVAQRLPLVTKYSLAESQATALDILLAEDNRVNQKVALALLGRAGHKVEVVENGRAAVEAIKNRDFDLVFMDVHMPEMDGFQATQTIRRMSTRMALVPIIAMTARAMQSDRQICLDSGMDDYLSKPINPVELYAAIDRQRAVHQERLAAWEESAALRERNQHNLTLEVLQSNGDHELSAAPLEKIGVEQGTAGANWDGSVLMPDEPMDIHESIEHVGDRKFWLELVEVFLAEMPGRIDSLRRLIEDGDAKEIENLAHSIKGSCAEMLAEPMRQVAQSLELCGREHNLVDTPELLEKLIDSYRELEEILQRERALVA